MSKAPTADGDAGGERPHTADAPLRRVLAAADVSLLAAVVERFWEDRGYRTTRTKRGSQRFLLVRDPAGDPAHIVWLDPDARATPKHIERLDRMAASFGDTEATVTTGRDYDSAVYAAAEKHDIECLADEQLVTLVTKSGLQAVVRRHATPSRGAPSPTVALLSPRRSNSGPRRTTRSPSGQGSSSGGPSSRSWRCGPVPRR
ncbi:hypothetical protein C2R22_14245 [Salinigranum rubrum]|uniref:Restriction endonuclease type IV Mrr domain-containing protein n=1 Tax=Salinigranum rubrum TaxID=755307 RepID=A0A2I8VL51_9EURY|nr:hypothetical protein [Salinigranum rubrum]AUV82657.1 hypothetical protein C2R22_14245 [Salinigranum rubrum]